MQKKKWVSILVALSLIATILLSACGSTAPATPASQAAASTPAANTPEAPAATAEAAPVDIRVTWWGDTNRHELYNKILDEFVKEYPNVTCIPEPSTWTDYWDKMQVQTAGGNAPDFMGMHPQFASDYIRRGVIEPLDGFIADGTISTDGWTEGTLQTGVVDGVNYMMAMGVTFSCNFINLGVIKELGLEPPSFDWSWDDMKTWGLQARAALDAQGKTNSWVVGDDSWNLNSWRYFVRQQGHELYNADGTIGFVAEDVEKYFTMYKEFRELGIVPDGATTTEFIPATLEDSLFSRDQILVARVPVNQFKLYCTTFPDKEVGIIRNQTAGSKGSAVGEFPEGAHFAVSSTTTPEKKLAAAQLLNFWVNTDTALGIFGLDQGVPGNLDKADAYAPKLDEYQLEIQKFVGTLSGIGTPSTFPPAGASEVDAAFRAVCEEVMFGYKEPAAAAEEFYKQAVDIVSKLKA